MPSTRFFLTLVASVKFPPLQYHFLLALKFLRGKQQNMLAWGVANLVHPTTTTLFPYVAGDNGSKRRRRLFESPFQKHNHLNDKATKHRRI
jgi:hypothetical protein